MNNLFKTLLIFGATAAGSLMTSFGQSQITVDEFGVGTYNGAPLKVDTTHVDPLTGAAHFSYTLPYIATGAPFDVVLLEPGTPSDFPSDLLRFIPNVAIGSTQLFFYSDASMTDPPDAPADTFSVPVNYNNNPVILTETGLFGQPYSEAGPNGAVMSLTPGQPGSDGNMLGTSYTFISEYGAAVPELSSIRMMFFGATCLLAVMRFRSRRHSQHHL